MGTAIGGYRTERESPPGPPQMTTATLRLTASEAREPLADPQGGFLGDSAGGPSGCGLSVSCSELSDGFSVFDSWMLAILCVNVCGLSDRLQCPRFRDLLDCTDILVCTEMRMLSEELHLNTHWCLNFPHYHETADDPTRFMGGVAFFVNKQLCPEVLRSNAIGPSCASLRFPAPAELAQIPANPLCDKAPVTEARMFTIVGAYFPTSSAERYAGVSSDALWDGIQGVLISSQADFRVLYGDFNAHMANLCTKVPLPSLSDNAPMPHASDHIALAGREQRSGPSQSLYIQIQRDSRDRRRPDPQGKTLIDRASECELTILNGARLIPAVQPPLPSCLPPNPPAIDGAPILGQSCEHPSMTQRSPEESREDPLLGSALWDPCPSSAEHTYFREAEVSVVDYMFISTNLLPLLRSFSIRRDREIALDHTLLCAGFG
uniref:Endonuclease/exonuclease/phosphatase domain-containing protein n=1 Tax=Chromera velia CCMP2878 TaxID=1169474 RepID=A0A0G4GIT1_9ALVE|eukprot:Cvel_22082.t1-p1 / transcript=Cvel_22082.t1 / gene=Cvel_22082 / organism=Chromera_velia_CCMP2878 / gene_product=hypothetical protein / transcript_product=hypothetical protein / location=Cvel_scaffold2134:30647-31945(+) / protein_length=433 / sequence_SO=supercontig / SO=protein_coding / is_pseudo=false